MHCFPLVIFLVAASTGRLLPSSLFVQAQHPGVWPAARIHEDYTLQENSLRTLSLGQDNVEEERGAAAVWTMTVGKDHEPLTDPSDLEILNAAVHRFMKIIQQSIPADASKRPINPDNQILLPLNHIEINIDRETGKTDASFSSSPDKVDESYTLDIPSNDDPKNDISLTAPTVIGALRGLQTLWQLLEFGWYSDYTTTLKKSKNDSHEQARETVFIIRHCPIHVVDAPEYAYRGILVDTARHYLPVDLLLRQLDVMEWNKLNVLHWHLTDSQSWPYQSKMYPKISARGAFCEECVYTARDVRRIVHQGALRGIRVIVELDMPGHNQVLANSHPELMTWVHRPNGKDEPHEPLDVTKESVYSFLETLLTEAGTLWTDPWIHVGGDEVSTSAWNASQSVHDYMKKNHMKSVNELQPYFEQRLLRMVIDQLGKRPIVWQEVFDLAMKNATTNINTTTATKTTTSPQQQGLALLPKETIVDVWMLNHLETRYQATLQGYNVLVSACWYLDHLYETWDTLYECNPRDFTATADHQKVRVLGGHASMWGERVDETNFWPRVWPRASAVAEKLWAGTLARARESSAERLHTFRCRMVQQGIAAAPIQTGVCSTSSSSAAGRSSTAEEHRGDSGSALPLVDVM